MYRQCTCLYDVAKSTKLAAILGPPPQLVAVALAHYCRGWPMLGQVSRWRRLVMGNPQLNLNQQSPNSQLLCSKKSGPWSDWHLTLLTCSPPEHYRLMLWAVMPVAHCPSRHCVWISRLCSGSLCSIRVGIFWVVQWNIKCGSCWGGIPCCARSGPPEPGKCWSKW